MKLEEKLENLCHRYSLDYGKVYDLSLVLEYRLIKREKGFFAYFFIDRSKYQDRVVSVLDRYYRLKKK